MSLSERLREEGERSGNSYLLELSEEALGLEINLSRAYDVLHVVMATHGEPAYSAEQRLATVIHEIEEYQRDSQ